MKSPTRVSTVQQNYASSSSRRFQCEFQSLIPSDLNADCQRLRHAQYEMDEQWRSEVQCYEQQCKTIVTEDGISHEGLANHNDPNSEGKVQDPSLFPYHNSCYPLLDAYDGLYQLDKNDVGRVREAHALEPSPIPPTRRHRGPPPSEGPIVGHMPNSLYAIYEALVQPPGLAAIELGPAGIDENGEDEHKNEHNTCIEDHLQPTIALVQAILHTSYVHWNDQFQVLVEAMEYQDDDDCCNIGSFWYHRALQDVNVSVDVEAHQLSFGPHNLPFEESANVWLKLLRHALSELQRDFSLAMAVLASITRAHALDDLTTTRYLLAILNTHGVKGCTGACHMAHRTNDITNNDDDEGPDHSCQDWNHILQFTVPIALAYGITFVTRAHATTLVAFCQDRFESVVMRSGAHMRSSSNGSASSTTSGWDISIGSEDQGDATNHQRRHSYQQQQQRARLMRHLVRLQSQEIAADDQEPTSGERDLPLDLMESVVLGLGSHAVIDCNNVQQLYSKLSDLDVVELQREDSLLLCLQQSVDSFHNCLSALAGIGELIVRFVPSVTPNTIRLSSVLMRVFTQVLSGPSPYSISRILKQAYSYVGLDRTDIVPPLKRVIHPFRYAESITNATERARQYRRQWQSCHNPFLTAAARIINKRPPPNQVVSVVRMLFLRDLVDVRVAGCGYGDFMVWCGVPTTPLDPLLFWTPYNLPTANDAAWDDDEDGVPLTLAGLTARHDFALWTMIRAWHRPWTPDNHHSYSPGFRSAITTVANCVHHLGLSSEFPREATYLIGAFLPRDAWDDPRSVCWCIRCQLEDAAHSLIHKLTKRQQDTSNSFAIGRGMLTGTAMALCPAAQPLKRLKACPDCGVAKYCSREHRQQDYKDGHKRTCCKPPYCIPGPEEDAFYSQIVQVARDRYHYKIPTDRFHGIDEADSKDRIPDVDNSQSDFCKHDGDDGSWESIDSEDTNNYSVPSEATISPRAPPITMTQCIHNFLEKRSFSEQSLTSSPFERVLNVQN